MNVLASEVALWKPVNKQASKLFWKSPWWAKATIEARQEQLPVWGASVCPSVFIDCFRDPPPEIPNRIGTIVEYSLTGERAMIIGFSRKNRSSGKVRIRERLRKYRFTNPDQNFLVRQMSSSTKVLKIWWAFFQRGDIGELRWDTARFQILDDTRRK